MVSMSYRCWLRLPCLEPLDVAQLDGRAVARRIVLLAPDGAVERVLALPAASRAHATLRRLASAHPGRTVAAEWQQGRRWVRYLTMQNERRPT